MYGKRFGNQDKRQIISHLEYLLAGDLKFNLFCDPLGIRFVIEEAHGMSRSDKKKIREQQPERRRIRNAKKGRTVNLKGRTDF